MFKYKCIYSEKKKHIMYVHKGAHLRNSNLQIAPQ